MNRDEKLVRGDADADVQLAPGVEIRFFAAVRLAPMD